MRSPFLILERPQHRLAKPTGPLRLDRAWAEDFKVKGLWLFNAPGNLGFDLSGNSRGTVTGSSIVQTPGVYGAHLNSTGDANNDRLDLGTIAGTHPLRMAGQSSGIAVLWRAWHPGGALPSNNPRIIDISDGGNYANGWGIDRSGSTTGYEFVINPGTADPAASSVSTTANKWEAWACSWDGTDVFWYLDGSFSNDGLNGAAGTIPSGSVNGAIANWNHSTDRNWSGGIDYILVCGRHIFREEMVRLQRDPFRYVQPIVVARSVFPVPGESATVTASQASVNVTAQVVGVTGTEASLSWGEEDFEGGNVDQASSSIADAATSTPDVTVVPYTNSNEAGGTNPGWGNFVGELTGCTGRAPVFQVSETSYWGSTIENVVPWYSEDSGATWSQFDTVSFSTGTLTFSHSSAFAANRVRFAFLRPVQWTDLYSRLTGTWAANAYVQETASSVAASGLPTYVFAQTAEATDQNSRVVPVQNQFAFWVTDTATEPADGKGKRTVVLVTGVHANEDPGSWAWQKAVDFLLAADSGGTADEQVAADLIKNFRFWCCPTTNPGRYYHHNYGYAADGNSPSHNPGTRWDDSPQNLAYLSNVLSAIAVDISPLNVEATFDFHTLPSDRSAGDQYNLHVQPGDDVAINAFEPRADVYQAGSIDQLDNSGALREYARDNWQAIVSVTAEQAVRWDLTESDVATQARRNLLALDDMWDDGFFLRFGLVSVDVSTQAVAVSGAEVAAAALLRVAAAYYHG